MTIPIKRELHKSTFGLATSQRDKQDVEQLYVRYTETEDVARPIQLDGWRGYSSIGKLNITRQQAKDLIGILAELL